MLFSAYIVPFKGINPGYSLLYAVIFHIAGSRHTTSVIDGKHFFHRAILYATAANILFSFLLFKMKEFFQNSMNSFKNRRKNEKAS